jgi:hypothetical protein
MHAFVWSHTANCRHRYLKFGAGSARGNCTSTLCSRITLEIAEVQVFNTLSATDFVTTTAVATSDSIYMAASGETHPAGLSIDNKPSTWFGSGSSDEYAWLHLDLGPSGPFYDQLKNITIWQRQGAGNCMDMIKCYKVDLHSELNELLETKDFGGPAKAVYILDFFQPPPR